MSITFLMSQPQDAFKAGEAGLTHIKYFGDIIPTTRRICRNILGGVYKKRSSNVFTVAEVRRLWSQQSWDGKKPGDPLVVRGGYNCRHQWSYVSPDWYNEDGQLIIQEQKCQKKNRLVNRKKTFQQWK